MTGQAVSHAALMDATYRYQRLIYDVTRRYYLLGRDHLIDNLAPPPGATILEIACGTGRNLDMVARRHAGCRLYGLDISDEMLASARVKLGARAVLVQADACTFDGMRSFGMAGFDRIVLSYSLSMIPDWQAALANAARHLAPGGQLHVVDFGDQAGLPAGFRAVLRQWLAKFHVSPRDELPQGLKDLAAEMGFGVMCQSRLRGYAQHGVLTRP